MTWVKSIGFASLVAIVWLYFVGGKFFSAEERIAAIALVAVGMATLMWIATLVACGLSVFRAVPVMAGIFGRSKRGTLLTGISLVCLMVWWSPMTTAPVPGREAMSLALLLVIALLWLQPPIVLVLGGSTRETGRILAAVSSHYFPLRVVALLDPRRTGLVPGAFSWLTDSLRTESDSDWMEVVERMADVTGLIVLDARTESPVVMNEVDKIIKNADRLRRTIFVVGANREAPALGERDRQRDDVRSVTEEELVSQLRSSKP